MTNTTGVSLPGRGENSAAQGHLSEGLLMHARIRSEQDAPQMPLSFYGVLDAPRGPPSAGNRAVLSLLPVHSYVNKTFI